MSCELQIGTLPVPRGMQGQGKLACSVSSVVGTW